VAIVLALDLIGRADVAADQHLDLVDHLGVILRLEVERLLGGVLGEFDDRLDHRLHLAVREHQRLDHAVLGSSCASDSTIIRASWVPATTRSRSVVFICSSVGLSVSVPSMMPTARRRSGP
jgi:hypothetical protein